MNSEPDIQLLYDAETIQQRVRQLGRRINGDAESDPLIVSLAGGSVIFLADLIRSVDRSIRFDFVQVHYQESGGADQALEIQFPISLDVRDQDLVILKDVVSTGVIETYLRTQFLDLGAGRVRFAALIDLPAQRRTDFQVDYRIFSAERQGTYVGYGLKYKGRHGNLPYIGWLGDG